MTAPEPGLPDLTKTLELFVHERQHLALGVLTQKAGGEKRPVGYFSKQLDQVGQGWLSCLWVVAATVLLIQEARKLTMGQKMTVYVPHAVSSGLEQKGGHWLSPSGTLKYQVVLMERDDVELKTTSEVNPALFLTKNQRRNHWPVIVYWLLGRYIQVVLTCSMNRWRILIMNISWTVAVLFKENKKQGMLS